MSIMKYILKPLSSGKTTTLLIILLLLFLFRVLAQLLQFIGDLPYLPDFEAWHSATIPYGWLLFSQGLIITIIISVIIRIHRMLYRFNKRRGILLLCLGSFYFLFMLARFLLSVTIMTSHPWFGATLPAFFHLVLASIVIVIGLYEYQGSLLKRNEY